MNARNAFRRLRIAVATLALAAPVAQAGPYESVSVTSHYDADGSLVGVEAHGSCGFPLYGTTGVTRSTVVISCADIDQVPLPY
ncbi:MAG: hypothetical protein ACTHOH_04315 [Lysobacteraceae bacterium]